MKNCILTNLRQCILPGIVCIQLLGCGKSYSDIEKQKPVGIRAPSKAPNDHGGGSLVPSEKGMGAPIQVPSAGSARDLENLANSVGMTPNEISTLSVTRSTLYENERVSNFLKKFLLTDTNKLTKRQQNSLKAAVLRSLWDKKTGKFKGFWQQNMNSSLSVAELRTFVEEFREKYPDVAQESNAFAAHLGLYEILEKVANAPVEIKKSAIGVFLLGGTIENPVHQFQLGQTDVAYYFTSLITRAGTEAHFDYLSRVVFEQSWVKDLIPNSQVRKGIVELARAGRKGEAITELLQAAEADYISTARNLGVNAVETSPLRGGNCANDAFTQIMMLSTGAALCAPPYLLNQHQGSVSKILNEYVRQFGGFSFYKPAGQRNYIFASDRPAAENTKILALSDPKKIEGILKYGRNYAVEVSKEFTGMTEGQLGALASWDEKTEKGHIVSLVKLGDEIYAMNNQTSYDQNPFFEKLIEYIRIRKAEGHLNFNFLVTNRHVWKKELFL